MTRIRLVERIVERAGYRQAYEPAEENRPVSPHASQLRKLRRGDSIRPRAIRLRAPAGMPEARLMRLMETHGIGRPSTYAFVVQRLLDHGFVQRTAEGALAPTDLGRQVLHALSEAYPTLFSVSFTAEMEHWLDALERGQASYTDVVQRVWQHIVPRV